MDSIAISKMAREMVCQALQVEVEHIPEYWVSMILDFSCTFNDPEFTDEEVRENFQDIIDSELHIGDTPKKPFSKTMQNRHDYYVRLYLHGQITTKERRRRYNVVMEWERDGLVLPYKEIPL